MRDSVVLTFLLSGLGALEVFQWLRLGKPTVVSDDSGETYIRAPWADFPAELM